MNGWLVLYKPEGITSAAAVGRVKRHLKVKKIGHAGTLDPLACGVLPLAIGEATKTVQYAMLSEKSYRFRIKWGIATDTDDAEGQVVATSDVRPKKEAILQIIPQFIGTVQQTPPAYSAIKVKGKRAYDLARKGEDVKLAARPIEIHALELEEATEEEAQFLVRCGKGTYVRSLARDIAAALGTKAYVTYLERTSVGKFTSECSILLENLEKTEYNATSSVGILPAHAVLDDIPVLSCATEDVERIRHGVAVPIPSSQAQGVTAVMQDGALVAIGEVNEARYFKPSRVFNL